MIHWEESIWLLQMDSCLLNLSEFFVGVGEDADKGIFDLANGIYYTYIYKALEDTKILGGQGMGGEILLWMSTR